MSTDETKKTTSTTDAYTAFNAVDEKVSKPVLGSDGAAAWQSFQTSTRHNSHQHGKSVAPTAPLKRLDRATGFSNWQEERAHEQDVRRSTGAAASGYTHFEKDKNQQNQITKKERKRIEQRLIGEDQEYFIPSKQFSGWKFDYVFTTKLSHGTGYYFDGMDSLKKLRGELTEERPAYSSKDNAEVSASSKTDEASTPKKKKRKKTSTKAPVIVHDPHNPLEQVAAALEKRQAIISNAALPDGWEAAVDESTQKPYYYNRTTGERTWESPSVIVAELPVGWSTARDEATGKTYYYNAATNETRWDRPTH